MPETQEANPCAGKRILVVDDAKTIRRLMQHKLTQLGCEVSLATDGFKALAVLRKQKIAKQPFDLIFLDIQMPDIDGYECCTLIRNQDRNVPVVMLSSADGVFDIAQGTVRGANGHVTKVPTDEVLRETVMKWAVNKGQSEASG
ncbi:hypothetical protein A3709_19760 [Halioglobus sp. HI00S01]|uniref:response regulator n=1 Tax=Halioglobus sp. HI00S01 TaxID=1822214 RepID=UPI0007C398E8|nr:response regulator [Halioglobus sp. HI00S01]KZX57863.1 hypothetical protein A3709_19760 [Halioglobus sp. HI00S01]